ncbi:unnamed protein product [Closterium sp. NIES-65]|nr:unnamed protein product [Closterium sp. NIES-65]
MAGSLSGDELANGKALVPFLQRADELQKHDPLVAYYSSLCFCAAALCDVRRCPVPCAPLPCAMCAAALCHVRRCPVPCAPLPCAMCAAALCHVRRCPVPCAPLPCAMCAAALCHVRLPHHLLRRTRRRCSCRRTAGCSVSFPSLRPGSIVDAPCLPHAPAWQDKGGAAAVPSRQIARGGREFLPCLPVLFQSSMHLANPSHPSLCSSARQDKAALQLSPDDGLHVEGFAQRVFSKADKQDRAGRADMCVASHGLPWGDVGCCCWRCGSLDGRRGMGEGWGGGEVCGRGDEWDECVPLLCGAGTLGTAKTFYAAGIFFEVCRQFGELALEVEQKQRYAVWKAADIRRALADGRRPTPGPPGGDADATAAAPADAAATATAPAVAPPAAPSFPSADSLDAMFSGPPAPSTYGANAAPAAPGGVSAMGGSGRLQVARPVGGGTAAMQPNPHAQANPYHQGHGDYLQAPQGQAAQAAQAWQQSTAASDSAFITSFATAPAAPSSSLPTPPANSLVSPPTFTHWAPDSQYPSATPPSTANPAAPSAPSAPAAGGWAQPAAAAAAPPFQQPQAGAAAAAAAAAGAFTNPMFATPPAPNAAPGGAAAASAGMGGAAGGTYGAHPSQASPHSEYGGGGGGSASGGGARAGHNVAAAANGSTAMASVSNCQGPGPREIADAHKAARYAFTVLHTCPDSLQTVLHCVCSLSGAHTDARLHCGGVEGLGHHHHHPISLPTSPVSTVFLPSRVDQLGMAETAASPHFKASLDTYVLRPLQRASSIMGSGELWQRAADMDEVVAEAHEGSVASTAATTNEGAATGKKWSVMGSTARKVQRMLFADKSDKSDKSAVSNADRKSKRLLPSLLSNSRRQERAGQDLSLRVGSCRVESAESVVDDGGEHGADLGRRSASFQHLAVDSCHNEMVGREATSVDEREDSEPGGADPERRAEGVDFISLSPRATSATNASGVPEGVDRPCSENEHSASPPESNSSRDRIVLALPRPVRPQTAPSKSAASPRHIDARDPIFSRRKTAPVAPAVLRESGAASGELKPQLADEPLLASASDWSSAALALVAPPPPPIDTPPALPLPSPVVPRPPSSDGVGNRSGRLRAGRGTRAGGRAGEGLRVDVAGRRQRSRHSDELAWAEALGGQVLARSKTAERDAGARGRTGGEVARVGRHHHLSASWDCEGEIRMGREDKGAFPVRVESLDEASWGSVSGRERPTSSGGRVPITAHGKVTRVAALMERPRGSLEDLSVASPCSPGADYHSAPELRGRASTPASAPSTSARSHVFDGLEPDRLENDRLENGRLEAGSCSLSDREGSESQAFLSAWSPPDAGRGDDSQAVSSWSQSRKSRPSPRHARSSSWGGSGWGGSGWICSALDPSGAACCLVEPCRAICSPKFFWQARMGACSSCAVSPSLPPSPPPSPSLPLPPRYSPSCRSLGAAQVASVAQWCTFNIIMILVNNEIFQSTPPHFPPPLGPSFPAAAPCLSAPLAPRNPAPPGLIPHLQRYGFAFPLTLTAIHFALSFVGAFTAIEVSRAFTAIEVSRAFTAIEILHVCPKAEVEAGEMVAWVMPMAVVTCFNVVLGQLSLRYVPLPALLSTKALSPGLTVAIQALALQAEYDWRLCLSLLPVMAGAMLAYAPSVHFALPTFLSALCCVVLGCATVICAEVLLKGKQYSLDSLNALYQLVPYSALILAPPAAVLEGWQLWGWFMAQANPWPAVIAILISGCFAFCLNFSLFYTIQKTSALTFNVAGNLKLVITLIFSWLLFRTPMAPISLLGCLLEVVGVVCYGWAIFSMRKQQVELLRSPSAQVRVEQEASDDIVQVYLGAML